MSKKRDLLIEIGTEELPPKTLHTLIDAFCAQIKHGLEQSQLQHGEVKPFASPRRLALLIPDLDETQSDTSIERRGPAISAAFDEAGNATKAAQGFARSCGIEVDVLEKLETDKGSWLVYRSQQQGKPSTALIPKIITQALEKLPIAKRMRWGNSNVQFVRPIHWVVILFGNEVVPATILDLQADRISYGHRFHHPAAVTIDKAANYEICLEKAKVIASFTKRKQLIRDQITKAAKQLSAHAVIDEKLLDEVTAMVEWPVALAGNFEQRFLNVPAEALISTMKSNQKYFHTVDDSGQLLPYFITIMNIDSKDHTAVQSGNERVIRPRFADAEFFWNQDRKASLENRFGQLRTVVFQHKLGSLYDKVKRISEIARYIATQLGANVDDALRCAKLCKCDLLTEMVAEFPDLQGIMGRYYALHDNEANDVANGISEHYMPRFADDDLPQTQTGQAVAIADRLDTLVGIFSIGQAPSGDKDPFALRRAALGILRILIECRLDLDLKILIENALKNYPDEIQAANAAEQVFAFIMERLRAYYHNTGISAQVFDAVISRQPSRPIDFDARIHAVDKFSQLTEAETLSAANKRIINILKKADVISDTIDANLLNEPAEKTLYDKLMSLDEIVSPLLKDSQYEKALTTLSSLRTPVDEFFDHVMVMAEDDKVRNNRIALLNKLSQLFLHIADVSRLQIH